MTQSYVEWLQSAPRSSLDRVDLQYLEADRKWRQDNPAKLAELDKLIGKTVTLDRTRSTFRGTLIPKGSEFVVFTHMTGILFARFAEAVYALKPEWVEVRTADTENV